ncbi:hypothetical protein EKK58_02905 [Candidatus Dependentiae bacterium]|nr:MAG: hypothetical protein EKK58_02905 [Candidatus Dependentiae bacterium]
MEINNDILIKIQNKENTISYEVKYKNTSYILLSQNINLQEGVLANIELRKELDMEKEESIPLDPKLYSNSFVITSAMKALTFEKPFEILDYFFNKIINDHLYEMYNFYSVLVPSNTFKNYFYTVMITKCCLNNSLFSHPFFVFQKKLFCNGGGYA